MAFLLYQISAQIFRTQEILSYVHCVSSFNGYVYLCHLPTDTVSQFCGLMLDSAYNFCSLVDTFNEVHLLTYFCYQKQLWLE